jgi:ADP-heptose:LPS heptosyltransferase
MKPRLLVLELHHLGDAVLSLPFVRGAREHFDVHVLCRPATRAVYELLAEPPKIHTWEPPWADERSCGAWTAIAASRDEGRVLRPLGFAAAVCAWADARIAILMAETRAIERVGFPMTHGNYYASDLPWRRQRRRRGRILEWLWAALHPGQPLLTRRLQRGSSDQPHLRCWEQIGEALGVSPDDTTPWITTGPADSARRSSRPILAIHARARLPSKQWPIERWRELTTSPAVTGNFDLVEILAAGTKPVTPDGVRKIQTPDLLSLAAALDSANAVLCHDSMPAHLAAALGKPVITIFGSGEPDWFAPWHNRDRVVQRRVCPLHPCIDRCGMDRYLCLEAVEVGDVLAQLQRLSAPI